LPSEALTYCCCRRGGDAFSCRCCYYWQFCYNCSTSFLIPQHSEASCQVELWVGHHLSPPSSSVSCRDLFPPRLAGCLPVSTAAMMVEAPPYDLFFLFFFFFWTPDPRS
jgi:hypothetical protein